MRDQILADGFHYHSPPLDSIQSSVREERTSSTSLPTLPEFGGLDWSSAGQEMKPLDWHKALAEARYGGVTPIVLDCRNSYETDVGSFKNAIPLNTTFFRESWAALEEVLRGTPRDTPVLTYCTGGIRCVKINAFLHQRMGFTNTHRLQGGIVAYNRELASYRAANHSHRETAMISATDNGAAIPIESLFKGVNYVFDERIGARVTEDVLTACEQCSTDCDSFTNCLNYSCNVSKVHLIWNILLR